MATITNISYVEARVKAIIVEKLGVDEHALVRDAKFHDTLGADSLDVLETFMALEKEFSITIPDEEAEKLTTIGSVVDYIIGQKN
jgi:acyl carrier protein